MPHFVVRHAATALNHPNELQSRVRAGGPDVGTSPEGKATIARMAQMFQHQRIHGVHTSDTSRAGETAQAIAKATGAPLHVHPELGPWDLGDLAGKKVGDIAHLLKALYLAHHSKDHGVQESFAEFYARFLLKAKALLGQRGNHVIVTHGRNVKTLMSLLHGGGRFHPSLPPHDPRPTQPGDVYLVHPHALVKVFGASKESR